MHQFWHWQRSMIKTEAGQHYFNPIPSYNRTKTPNEGTSNSALNTNSPLCRCRLCHRWKDTSLETQVQTESCTWYSCTFFQLGMLYRPAADPHLWSLGRIPPWRGWKVKRHSFQIATVVLTYPIFPTLNSHCFYYNTQCSYHNTSIKMNFYKLVSNYYTNIWW